VTGRCTDAAIFAAIPIREGLDPGLAWYAGKILECGCLAAFPITLTDTMTARITAESVVFEPGSPDRACTVTSVAGHSMYEREDPYYQPEPGGALDLRELVLTQEGPRRVRATGARWIPAPYTVKLEGAARVGFRAMSVAGVRDPIMIEQLDEVLAQVRAAVQAEYPRARHTVVFHCFGRDGVMGRLEPLRNARPHEIGLVTQVVADAAEQAAEICDFAQHLLLHHPYPGIKATAGNLALLGSVEVLLPVHGAVYEYSVDHVMRIDDPCECFPLSVEEV
ncbi:MAG: acyclic terpene utilization AtuA family protein, partial [Armatimonadetes bacterium]|nr:acyclic terpene utilization AtuA family protein [Armatimonadota bacterium]